MIKKIKIPEPYLDKVKTSSSKNMAAQESEDTFELIAKKNNYKRKESMECLLHLISIITIIIGYFCFTIMILSLLVYYCVPESWTFLYSCRLKADQIDAITKFLTSTAFVSIFTQAKKTYLKRYK
jgi:hypothetical protein